MSSREHSDSNVMPQLFSESEAAVVKVIEAATEAISASLDDWQVQLPQAVSRAAMTMGLKGSDSLRFSSRFRQRLLTKLRGSVGTSWVGDLEASGLMDDSTNASTADTR